MTKYTPEPDLLDMLVDPAYYGPSNSCEPVLGKLLNFTGYEEPFDDEYGLAILKWLGTYLIPSSPLTLPCPSDQNFLGMLSVLFNYLPARSLLHFLDESKTILVKTLANVRAAAPERSDWIGELERRYAVLDGLIERAAHNAIIEDSVKASGFEDVQRIFCPICDKLVGSDSDPNCIHYLGYSIDGNQFGWENEIPDFFDEVSQLNRTINRSKTKDAIFKVLLAEAPAEIGKLFQEVREKGSSYWTWRDSVYFNCWNTDGCGSSSSMREYFNVSPAEFATSIRTEAQQALDWLEAFHPEILVKRKLCAYKFYEDHYWGGYE